MSRPLYLLAVSFKLFAILFQQPVDTLTAPLVLAVAVSDIKRRIA